MGFLDWLFSRPRSSATTRPRLRLEPLEQRLFLSGVGPALFEPDPELLHAAATEAAANPPVVTIEATDANAAEQGRDPGVFTVTRSEVTDRPLAVFYRLGGKAENGGDYDELSGQVVIPANAATATITVRPKDGPIYDPNETVIATLEKSRGYSLDSNLRSATIAIADNEPVVSIQATDANAAEQGRDPGVFTVERSVVSDSRLAVRYSVSGTATPDLDYPELRGWVIIRPDQATATITVKPWDDKVGDPAETIIITIRPRCFYGVDSNHKTATVTITDNEPYLTVTASGAAEQGRTPGTFTITRSVVTSHALVLEYRVAGTATPDVDYHRLSGTVVIPKNQASATISVKPIDDKIYDPNEYVVILLHPPTPRIGIDPAHATPSLFITDNEPTVSIQATDPNAAEALVDPGVFTVTRTGATDRPLTVHYHLGGTADPESDYQELSGSVVIPASQTTATIIIKPVNDLVKEPSETVVAMLRPGIVYGVSSTQKSATVTIADDDPSRY